MDSLFFPPTPRSSSSSPSLGPDEKYILPSADPSHGQPSAYWGGSAHSGSHSSASSRASVTSPSNTGSYYSTGSSTADQQNTYSSAPQSNPRTIATQQGSPSDMDASERSYHSVSRDDLGISETSTSSSLAARRQQNNLPQFNLNNTRTSYAGYGNFPTPPPLGPHEIATSMASACPASSQGMSSYSNYQASASHYGYPHSATASSQNYSPGMQAQSGQNLGDIRSYSPPHGTYGGRSSRADTPATGEIIPNSPYEAAAAGSAYQSSMGLTSCATSSLTATAPSTLPSIGHGTSAYATTYNINGTQTSSHSPINSQPQQHQPQPQQQSSHHDPYSSPHGLPPPHLHNPSPPPASNSGSYYTNTSTTSYQTQLMSPTTPTSTSLLNNSNNNRTQGSYSAPSHPPLMPLQPQPQYRPSYSLPGMGLTNVSLLGMGGSAHSMHLHGQHPGVHHHHGHHHSPQDRPFKCDQCPQSFSRNHDLKRHKRIHLAVKPFPCDNCDKSFSRKDALKRHRLVKGCGKAADAKNHLAQQQQQSSTIGINRRPSSSSTGSSSHNGQL